MLNKERQNAILEYIIKKPAVSVTELSTAFDVSTVTIRKDLNELSIEGKIERTHGGALPLQKSIHEEIPEKPQNINTESKHLIAVKAMKLIKESSSIMLDAGSTIMELAKLIEESNFRDMTIITHAMDIAEIFEKNDNFTLIVIGGVYHHGIQSNIGPYAVEQMAKIYADYCFLDIDGYAPEEGLTTRNPYEAEIKKTLLRQSKKRFLLADSSKYGNICMSKVADLTDIHGVVSDDNMKESARLSIQRCGVKVF